MNGSVSFYQVEHNSAEEVACMMLLNCDLISNRDRNAPPSFKRLQVS